ncbi:MAG: aminomethyl-transferring glycine dehydrogenase [Deltaproteobacteria bacterium]|nr:aminomethyl-transferring glycine dehydrogenase [Deltaproteobacteria bacterium]
MTYERKFVDRHIGPHESDLPRMLQTVGASHLDALLLETIPESIRLASGLDLPEAKSEADALTAIAEMGRRNQVFRSYIGCGYYDCFTPTVILRNVLENPGWYTQYTPYQAEISQGRLEALLNFQQMIMDLTGLGVAGASLLDEGTAAAEAMQMLAGLCENPDADRFFVSHLCHPQTIEVVRTRAEPRGIRVEVGDHREFAFDSSTFGALIQYPATDGTIFDYRDLVGRAHAAGAKVAVAADLMSLALLCPPGEWGADVALGSAQRFGVPMGYGGPHAAYIATTSEHTRRLPGRLIGVSQDVHGNTALRMALQTREQHIRREKATSNICTAQVLLAVMASMYAVYHGPSGIRHIAESIARRTRSLREALQSLGLQVPTGPLFDTFTIKAPADQITAWHTAAHSARMNFRVVDETCLGISLDETTTDSDLRDIVAVLGSGRKAEIARNDSGPAIASLPDNLKRNTEYLKHPVFNLYHSETEMLRYIRRLESRDLSLGHSMIPLGSCTMKLNATSEMIPITSPDWARLHPFAPLEQTRGYQAMFGELERFLSVITGFPGVSLQPNAGSQGELAGLLVIRQYHLAHNGANRNICLIPSSAHGTNPATATMAGYQVVVVRCDDRGNVDLADLDAKATQHSANLAALMITYPSTHGVFEQDIRRICTIVHQHGGQVYMDGANMNAQVGLCRPADFGADVCHLNLHKTFCIPHGGGGPGMGPIACGAHLKPFLPGHPLVKVGGTLGPISAAPWGSADILLISYAYILMMGGDGLRKATEYAILNANYVAKRLDPYFPVVYKGAQGRVAHECIVDMRFMKKAAGVEVEDVAKRLMDYGFHAPTMSFPIPSTMMIEPTESEALAELDRFCEAMIAIRGEIADIEAGRMSREDNPLKNAPHTAESLLKAEWNHPYSREQAAYPLPWVRGRKFWPSVGRINNVLGDRQFVCSCPPMEAYR